MLGGGGSNSSLGGSGADFQFSNNQSRDLQRMISVLLPVLDEFASGIDVRTLATDTTELFSSVATLQDALTNTVDPFLLTTAQKAWLTDAINTVSSALTLLQQSDGKLMTAGQQTFVNAMVTEADASHKNITGTELIDTLTSTSSAALVWLSALQTEAETNEGFATGTAFSQAMIKTKALADVFNGFWDILGQNPPGQVSPNTWQDSTDGLAFAKTFAFAGEMMGAITSQAASDVNNRYYSDVTTGNVLNIIGALFATDTYNADVYTLGLQAQQQTDGIVDADMTSATYNQATGKVLMDWLNANISTIQTLSDAFNAFLSEPEKVYWNSLYATLSTTDGYDVATTAAAIKYAHDQSSTSGTTVYGFVGGATEQTFYNSLFTNLTTVQLLISSTTADGIKFGQDMKGAATANSFATAADVVAAVVANTAKSLGSSTISTYYNAIYSALQDSFHIIHASGLHVTAAQAATALLFVQDLIDGCTAEGFGYFSGGAAPNGYQLALTLADMFTQQATLIADRASSETLYLQQLADAAATAGVYTTGGTLYTHIAASGGSGASRNLVSYQQNASLIPSGGFVGGSFTLQYTIGTPVVSTSGGQFTLAASSKYLVQMWLGSGALSPTSGVTIALTYGNNHLISDTYPSGANGNPDGTVVAQALTLYVQNSPPYFYVDTTISTTIKFLNLTGVDVVAAFVIMIEKVQ